MRLVHVAIEQYEAASVFSKNTGIRKIVSMRKAAIALEHLARKAVSMNHIYSGFAQLEPKRIRFARLW